MHEFPLQDTEKTDLYEIFTNPELEPALDISEGFSILYDKNTGKISLGDGAYRTFIPAQE